MNPQDHQRRQVTRNRERLACGECRHRKLRCDRRSPCGSCARRGVGSSCGYEPHSDARGGDQRRQRDAEERLQRLEQLVQQLADGSSSSSSGRVSTSSNNTGTASTTRPTQQVALSRGAREDEDAFRAREHTYSGSTHWSAVLEDIRELRFAITPEGPATMDPNADPDCVEVHEPERYDTGIGILFGGASSVQSLEEVLAKHLAPRHDIDGLVSAYFRARSIVAPFVHAAEFQKQYEAFWNNPTATPPLWASILFSICHIATNTVALGGAAGETTSNTNNTGDGHRFSRGAARCLVVGEYVRPKRFAVEALLLFAQSQCLTRRAALPPEIGVITGLLLRLATSSGYHRDPTALSPFAAEMRRRTWSMCVQFDVMVSFHLGLPSAVPPFLACDTQAPRNLLDSDLDADSLQVPPSRPDSEATDVSFYLAKHKLMMMLDKILRHALAVRNGDNDDDDDDNNNNTEQQVCRLDAQLRSLFDTFPLALRPRRMTDSVVDASGVVVTRLCVLFIYNKCLCALHRPHVLRRRAASISACHAAATALVAAFADAYRAFLPGGQAETERWFLSSINWHDFLFGITALCLALCVGAAGTDVDVDVGVDVDVDVASTVALLVRARHICVDYTAGWDGATRRVVSLVDAVALRFGGRTRDEGLDSALAVPSPGTIVLDQQLQLQPRFVHGEQMYDWGWRDDQFTASADDTSWAYLDRFLDLPGDEAAGTGAMWSLESG